MGEHPVLRAVLLQFHDTMAPRTIPRIPWMSADWVTIAREIITTRAACPKLGSSPKYSPRLTEFRYQFVETFTGPPVYVKQDGAACGFWVVADHGRVTVGEGSFPEEHGEADMLTKGQYIPNLGGGRTVNAALDEEEKKLLAEYQAN